jgi:pimeloyl-ACP methyl ester carboxylesterase
VAGLLAPELTVVAYDRRGYGQTPVSTEPFSHLDDLLTVLDHAGAGPVWLAGASAGAGWHSTPPSLLPTGSRAWW